MRGRGGGTGVGATCSSGQSPASDLYLTARSEAYLRAGKRLELVLPIPAGMSLRCSACWAPTLLLLVVGAALATCGSSEEALPPLPPFRLPRHITSHAVLQAEAPRLTGWAPSGATVTIKVSDGEQARAVASASGAWSAALRARNASSSASGGVTITLSTASAPAPIVLEDILFGDVWLCSGCVAQLLRYRPTTRATLLGTHVVDPTRVRVAGRATWSLPSRRCWTQRR